MINLSVKLLDDSNATLNTYILERQEYGRKDILRPAMIVCPGGGYSFVSQNEGEPVALAFARDGYHTFVLKYSTGISNPFPQALTELAAAYLYVYNNADKYFIDRNQISVCGFSAGGHLVLSLATFFNADFLTKKFNVNKKVLKPFSVIAGYPAISLRNYPNKSEESKEKIKELIAKGLMGDFGPYSIIQIVTGKENYSESDLAKVDLLNHVHENMPPIFLFGSNQDQVIYPTDILEYALKLRKLNNEFEFHLYNRGNHGLALYDHTMADPCQLINMHCNTWINEALLWLKENGVKND